MSIVRWGFAPATCWGPVGAVTGAEGEEGISLVGAVSGADGEGGSGHTVAGGINALSGAAVSARCGQIGSEAFGTKGGESENGR